MAGTGRTRAGTLTRRASAGGAVLALIGVSLVAVPSGVAGADTTPTTTTTATPTSGAERIIVAVGSTGYRVKDLQIRLTRLGFPSGTIDGIYDAEVTNAVAKYLAARGLKGDGRSVRQTVWTAIVAATATPVVITAGSTGAYVKELQGRLKRVGHWPYAVDGVYNSTLASRVLAFQRAYNVPHSGLYDTSTRAVLLRYAYSPTTFDWPRFNAGLPPFTPPVSSLDLRCRTGRVLCASKNSRVLVWLVNGTPRGAVWARYGGPETPTREGTFNVYKKQIDVISNLFGTPMPYSMFFSGGQAVHYSSNFSRLGYAGASHGCINVKDLTTLKRIYFEVYVGDKVVVYK